MRGVRWHARGDVRFEIVPDAPDPGPGEIRVSVAWCGICGSDLHEYLYGPLVVATSPHPVTGQCAPIVLGHEVSGVIESVGFGVRGLEVGQPVALNALIPCGRCDMCAQGTGNLCRTLGHIGQSAHGGLAEALTVPASMAVASTSDVPLDHLALAEPVSVAVRCVRRSGLRPGDRLLVIGAGAIGLAAAEVARVQFGTEVTVADISPTRLERPHQLGFDTLDMRSVTPSAGPGDWPVVIDASGAESVLETEMGLVQPGGTILLAGLPPRPSSLDVARLVLHEISIMSALGHLVDDDLRPAVALIESGELRSEALITRRIGLRDAVVDGLDVLAGPDGGNQVKILVEP